MLLSEHLFLKNFGACPSLPTLLAFSIFEQFCRLVIVVKLKSYVYNEVICNCILLYYAIRSG